MRQERILKRLSLVCLLLAFAPIAFGQISTERILRNAKKKSERKVEQRIERRIDKGVDKTLDNVEDAIDGKEKPQPKETAKPQQKPKPDSKDKAEEQSVTKEQTTSEEVVQQAEAKEKPQLNWASYDFVPGTEIIFEDLLENETNGEFPSKWDLVGGVVENAVFDGSNVIYFREAGNFPSGIVPLMENSKEDYLPEAFTIEFDAYYAADVYNKYFIIAFYDAKNQKNNGMQRISVDINNAKYGNTQKVYPGAARSNIDKEAKWRHIAISFNKRALKVYMDDTRMINIPNITENPTGLTIGSYNHREGQFFIKNIRIAKGAVPLYDKVLTDGKFVTTGIRFDVNKATIKPESAGTINYVVKMLNDNPQLKFIVEGHTDSDGDAAMNQKLSEARAKAVMDELILMGIDASRLQSKGHGESNPLASNNTPEGKAQNRRVEFVSF